MRSVALLATALLFADGSRGMGEPVLPRMLIEKAPPERTIATVHRRISGHTPHQGKRERERRLRQMAKKA